MNKKHKILYIQKPPGGGSVVALFDLIKVLDKEKFEPVVLCYELNQYTSILKELGVKTIFLSSHTPQKIISTSQKKPLKIFASLRKLKRLIVDDRRKASEISVIIKKQQIDLIHHNNDINDSRQGVLANRQTKLPQVCHYRSLKPYNTDRVNRRVDSLIAKDIDSNIYISRAVEEHFTKALGIPHNKGQVIRDIIDIKKFKPAQKNATLLREFNISSNEIIISNIGRISRWKGQHIFIKALAAVCKQYPAMKALVVGPYDKGIGEPLYFEELKQLVVDLQLTGNVILTGNRGDVPGILSISDIVVHSAIAPEPQGLVIVEALMYGKPVIVSDAGGAAELIVNDEGGLKTTPGDVEELTSAILQLISEISKHKLTPSQPSRPAILSEFDPVKQIKAIEHIYESLLN